MNISIRNISLCAFALATVVLAGLLIQANQQLQLLAITNEQSRAQAASERAVALKRAAVVAEQLAAAEKNLADTEVELKDLRAKPPAAAAASGRTRDPAAALAMMDNPAVQKMMAGAMKGGLDQRYAALFRKLKLSSTDLDKLKELIVEKQMVGLDVLRAAQTQGLNPGSNAAELSSLMTKAQGDLDENIRSLLGDTGYGEYQDFNKNIGAYGLLDQIERRLSFTRAPLETAQSQSLLHVLGETTKSPAVAGAPGVVGGAAFMGLLQGMGGSNPMMNSLTQPKITDQTVVAAQAVLSPPQLEVLKQLQTEQQNQLTSLKSIRGGKASAPSGRAGP